MARSHLWRLFGLAMLPCVCLTGCGGGEKKPVALSHVTINSTPEQEAALVIDGVQRGVSPLTLEDLTPGIHEVIAKKNNFVDGYDTITVKGGETPERFDIAMEPFVGYFSVDSRPGGAEVLIDGESIGTTPIIQKALRVGKHAYELRIENYYPITQELDIQRDYKYGNDTIHELKAIEAKISVTSRPTGALIFINNEQQSQTAPTKFTLSAGTYLIGVWTKGYVQEERMVTLDPNSSQELDLVMKEGNVPQGMVLIPGGEFIWGAESRAPDETPKRTENLKAFYMDKYEVTNAQFKEVFPNYDFPKGRELWPASGVSWNQAMKYAETVKKRLPTEAEWEKAARGTDGREFPWGDQFDKGKCNALESSVTNTTRAGAYLEGASPFGLMDMSGNVAEWLFDWYDRYPGNKDVAKDYGQVYRVLRGGSFASERFDVRCARRHFDKVDAKKPEYGLRCAKDAE